eukprot:5612628-Amphidinium_carterae.1
MQVVSACARWQRLQGRDQGVTGEATGRTLVTILSKNSPATARGAVQGWLERNVTKERSQTRYMILGKVAANPKHPSRKGSIGTSTMAPPPTPTRRSTAPR